MWTKAAADFMKSYQEFMGLMGMVPREDYEALSKENEALKKKVEDLEASLRRGSKKPGGTDVDPDEVVKGFEGLMKKQAEQFQALMASYGKLYEAKKTGQKTIGSPRARSVEKERVDHERTGKGSTERAERRLRGLGQESGRSLGRGREANRPGLAGPPPRRARRRRGGGKTAYPRRNRKGPP
jgi:hypothetical protein